MLAVISPAKKLDFETDPRAARFTQPQFLEETKTLVKTVRRLGRDVPPEDETGNELAEYPTPMDPVTPIGIECGSQAFDETYNGQSKHNGDGRGQVLKECHGDSSAMINL